MSIAPPKRHRALMITAAIISIPSGIACIFTFLGQHDTLKFAWLMPYAPIAYTCFTCGALLWLVYLILDYMDVRHAAFTKPSSNPNSTDYSTLIEQETKARAQAIKDIYTHVNGYHNQADIKFNKLFTPRTEPSLKQRTTQLANELFALLQKLGPQPPEPLSLPASEQNTEAKQLRAQNAYLEWQKRAYYNYMAYFRDRVVRTDYELAAEGVMTKLDERELDPACNSGHVDIKKIAEVILLTAQHMPN
jgi:hypothetical protein